MYCSKEKSISVYYSFDRVICLVPCPRLDGVIFDATGKPFKVKYPTYELYTKCRYYPDLKGLNKYDHSVRKVDLVVYVLADGSLLAADKAACEKATEARNNATPNGERCFLHLVEDLVLLDSLPVKTAEWDFAPFEF